MEAYMSGSNILQLDTKLNWLKERVSRVIDMSLERVVAHNENPQYYPLPGDNKSLERALHRLFESLPARNKKKVIDKVNKTLKANSTERNRIYGDLAEVNFRSSASLVEQVKSKPLPSNIKLTQADVNELRRRQKLQPVKPRKPARLVPAQAAVASQVTFVIESL